MLNNQEFKPIQLPKALKEIESMNPLHLRIEDIAAFPDDIPVTAASTTFASS